MKQVTISLESYIEVDNIELTEVIIEDGYKAFFN